MHITPSEMQIMRLLIPLTKATTIVSLAKKRGVCTATAYRHIKKLEEKGLLAKRKPHQKQAIILTDKGRKEMARRG